MNESMEKKIEELNLMCEQYEKRIKDVTDQNEALVRKLHDKCKEYEMKIKEINCKNDATICELITDKEALREKLTEKNKLIHNWAERAKIVRRKTVTKEFKYFKETMHYVQQGLTMIDLSSAVNEKLYQMHDKEKIEALNNEISDLKNQLMNANFLVAQQKFEIADLKQHKCPKPDKPKKETKKEMMSNILPLTPESYTTGDSMASDDSLYQTRLSAIFTNESDNNMSTNEKSKQNKDKKSKYQELSLISVNKAKIKSEEQIKKTQEESSALSEQTDCLSPGLNVAFITSDEDSNDGKELDRKSLKITDCKGQYDLFHPDYPLSVNRVDLPTARNDHSNESLGINTNVIPAINYVVGSPGMSPNSNDAFDVIKYFSCPNPISWEDQGLLSNSKPKIIQPIIEMNDSVRLADQKQIKKNNPLLKDQSSPFIHAKDTVFSNAKDIDLKIIDEFNKVSCSKSDTSIGISNLSPVINYSTTGSSFTTTQPVNSENKSFNDDSAVKLKKSVLYKEDETENVNLLPYHLNDHDYCNKSSVDDHFNLPSKTQTASAFIDNKVSGSCIKKIDLWQPNHLQSSKSTIGSDHQNTLSNGRKYSAKAKSCKSNPSNALNNSVVMRKLSDNSQLKPKLNKIDEFVKLFPSREDGLVPIENPTQEPNSPNNILSITIPQYSSSVSSNDINLENSPLLITVPSSLDLNFNSVDHIHGNAQAMLDFPLSTIASDSELSYSTLMSTTTDSHSLTVKKSPQAVEGDCPRPHLDTNYLNKHECTVVDPKNNASSIGYLLTDQSQFINAKQPSDIECSVVANNIEGVNTVLIHDNTVNGKIDILSHDRSDLKSFSYSNSRVSPEVSDHFERTFRGNGTEAIDQEATDHKSFTGSNTWSSPFVNNAIETSEKTDKAHMLEKKEHGPKSSLDICVSAGENDCKIASITNDTTPLSTEGGHAEFNIDTGCTSKAECTLIDPIIEENNMLISNYYSVSQLLKNQAEFSRARIPIEKISTSCNASDESGLKKDYKMDHILNHKEAFFKSECLKNQQTNGECQVNQTNHTCSVSTTNIVNKIGGSSLSNCINIVNTSSPSNSNETPIQIKLNNNSNKGRSFERLDTLDESEFCHEESKLSDPNFNHKPKNILNQITTISVPECNQKFSDKSKHYQEQLMEDSSKIAHYESNSYIVPNVEPLPDAMYKYNENLTKTNTDFTNYDRYKSSLVSTSLNNANSSKLTAKGNGNPDTNTVLHHSIDDVEKTNLVRTKRRIAHQPVQNHKILKSIPFKDVQAIKMMSSKTLSVDQKPAFIKCNHHLSESNNNSDPLLSLQNATNCTIMKIKNESIENIKNRISSPTFPHIEQTTPNVMKTQFLMRDKTQMFHHRLQTSPPQTYSVFRERRNKETIKNLPSQNSSVNSKKLCARSNKARIDSIIKETNTAHCDKRVPSQTLPESEKITSQLKDIDYVKNKCQINNLLPQAIAQFKKTTHINEMFQPTTFQPRKRTPSEYSPIPNKKCSIELNKDGNIKTTSSRLVKSTNHENKLPHKKLPLHEQITPKLKEMITVNIEQKKSSQCSLICKSLTPRETRQTKNTEPRKSITSSFYRVSNDNSFNDNSTVLNRTVDVNGIVSDDSVSVAPNFMPRIVKMECDVNETDSKLLSECQSDQIKVFNVDGRGSPKYFEILKQEPFSSFDEPKVAINEINSTSQDSQPPQKPSSVKNLKFIPKFYCDYDDSSSNIESASCKVETSLDESKMNVKLQLPMLNRYRQKTLSELIPQGEKLDVSGNVLRAVVGKHSSDIDLYKSRNANENRKYIQVVPGKDGQKVSEVFLQFFHGGMANMDTLKNTANKLNCYSCTTILMGLIKAVNQEFERCVNTKIRCEDKLDSLWILRITRPPELPDSKAPKLFPVVYAVIVLIINVRENNCQTPHQISEYMDEALTFIESTLLNTNGFDYASDKTLTIFICQLYAGLARLSGKLIRVRRFIYDMLYCFVKKSLTVTYYILLSWPEVFPPHTSRSFYADPLALSVINSLINGNEPKLSRLVSSYCYKNPRINSDVLFDLCLDNLCDEGVFEAFFLTFKRASRDWFLKKPFPMLLKLVKEWQAGVTPDNVAVTAIRLLSTSTRALNPAETQFILDPLFSLFKEILFDHKTPHWMAEVIVLNVCCLSRLNWYVCTDIISAWKPKQISSEVIDQILLNIIGRQNWRKKCMQAYLNK